MRKSLKIFLIFVLIIAVIILIWFFFFKKNDSGNTFFGGGNPFPIGDNSGNNGGNNNTGSNGGGNNNQTGGQNNVVKYLFQIWDKPTAGFGFIQTPILISSTSTDKKGKEIIIQTKSTTTSLIFADRMTGHIYKKELPNGILHKVSNSTLPGIYDAYFFENGKTVLMRYFNSKTNKIDSVMASIPQLSPKEDPKELDKIISLPSNISSVAVNKSGNELSYLIKNSSGSNIYSYSSKKGSVFKSSFKTSEWNLIYGGEKLYAQSSPSAYIPGYFINVDKNERIIGDKTGVTVLPDSSDNNFFVSMWSNSGLASFIFSRKTGLNTLIPNITLSEKCISLYSFDSFVCAVPDTLPRPINGLPDDWYQGRVSFRDNFYLIKNGGISNTFFFSLSDTAEKDFDTISLQTEESSSYLGFINKNEGDFWILLTKEFLIKNGFSF